MLNYYQILGIPRDADLPTIRSARRASVERVRRLAPESQVPALIREIDMAFVVLRDPVLRARYDAKLPPPGAEPPPTPMWDTPSPPTRPLLPRDAAAHARPTPVAASSHAGNARRHPQETAAAVPARHTDGRIAQAEQAFSERRWSGFWRRVAAYWIDSLLLYLPLLALAGLLFWWGGAEATPSQLALYGLWTLLFLLLQWWLLGGASVATPGRAAAGIAVVDAARGAPLTRGRSLLRALLSVASYLIVLPHLAMLFTQRKQTLADLASGAVVVAYRPARTALVVATLLGATFVLGVVAAVAIPAYQSAVLQVRLPDVRTDLRGYSLALERHWREGRPTPASIEDLDYQPIAPGTDFALTEQGAVIAIVAAGGLPAGTLMLVPTRTEGSSEIVWRCVSLGLPARLRPADCPAADDSRPAQAPGPQAGVSLN